MNRFAYKRTRLFVVVTWLFITAFFNDGANLTDIVSDTVTIHYDEGDGTGEIEQYMNSGSDLVAPVHSTADWHLKALAIQPVKPSPIRHFVLDEDSPSLCAIRVVFSHPYFLYPQEETLVYETVTLSESLYLQNRTLLI
jgi:hypothetical protein